MDFIVLIYNKILCVFSTPKSNLLMNNMMMSSNGNIFRVTGHLCGKFSWQRCIPAQRPVTRSFDVFFGLRLNKRLSKQSWSRWFQTPSRLLWHHCNATRHVAQLNESSITQILWQEIDSEYRYLNTLRLRENGRHFANDIFKCIFLNENYQFRLRFHWSLFLRFELTKFQHWFR